MKSYVGDGITIAGLQLFDCFRFVDITLFFNGAQQKIFQPCQIIALWGQLTSPFRLTKRPSNIHTYITAHYNLSVRIIDLVSHTTYVVGVNFIHKWLDLQFKANFERQIFLRNFRWQFYLLSEFLPEICWEEIAAEILFVFCFDVWPDFTSNKPTHYPLHHGDFKHLTQLIDCWTSGKLHHPVETKLHLNQYHEECDRCLHWP